MDHVDEASVVAEEIKECAQHEVQAGFLHALLAINETLRLIHASLQPPPTTFRPGVFYEHLDEPPVVE